MADDYADWRPEPLPDGWSLVPTDRRRIIEDELAVEVTDGHVLSGKRLFAIAACNACDHTLVRTIDEEWAIVHVTFRGAAEEPPWPSTELFDGRLPRDEMAAHAH